jgi:hypothetical protein
MPIHEVDINSTKSGKSTSRCTVRPQTLDVCLNKVETVPCNDDVGKDVLEAIRKHLLKVEEQVLGVHHGIGGLFHPLTLMY